MWQYFMSFPVSSLSTAFIISIGKRRLSRILGDSLSWLTAAQDSIAFCATEQKFGFLIQVLWAGALGCSGFLASASLSNLLGGFTLGAYGGGISASGSTLGAATLGFNLEGTTGSGGLCGKRVVGVLAAGVDQLQLGLLW